MAGAAFLRALGIFHATALVLAWILALARGRQRKWHVPVKVAVMGLYMCGTCSATSPSPSPRPPVYVVTNNSSNLNSPSAKDSIMNALKATDWVKILGQDTPTIAACAELCTAHPAIAIRG
eukprot:g5315.t1